MGPSLPKKGGDGDASPPSDSESLSTKEHGNVYQAAGIILDAEGGDVIAWLLRCGDEQQHDTQSLPGASVGTGEAAGTVPLALKP